MIQTETPVTAKAFYQVAYVCQNCGSDTLRELHKGTPAPERVVAECSRCGVEGPQGKSQF